MSKTGWLVLAVAVVWGLYSWKSRPLTPPAGQLVNEVPLQQATDRVSFRHGDFQIEPLASYQIKARVLARESYRFDNESALSPLDLALGWGPMSDTAVLDKIDIRQSGRFYYWQVEDFPIPRQQIEVNSANVHLVPANASVEKRLKSVRVGQVVTLKGLLIAARGDSGWQWRSSLTREDTGNGACELFWVEEMF